MIQIWANSLRPGLDFLSVIPIMCRGALEGVVVGRQSLIRSHFRGLFLRSSHCDSLHLFGFQTMGFGIGLNQ